MRLLNNSAHFGTGPFPSPWSLLTLGVALFAGNVHLFLIPTRQATAVCQVSNDPTGYQRRDSTVPKMHYGHGACGCYATPDCCSDGKTHLRLWQVQSKSNVHVAGQIGCLSWRPLSFQIKRAMSLLALSVVRGISPIWSLSERSGHWLALALNASVANDPKRSK